MIDLKLSRIYPRTKAVQLAVASRSARLQPA
jgi:hypothetical protein